MGNKLDKLDKLDDLDKLDNLDSALLVGGWSVVCIGLVRVIAGSVKWVMRQHLPSG
jgi:hypothetical protein